MKTCPYCGDANNEDDAKCGHCGRRLKGDFGFYTYLLMTGVLGLAVGGFFFWPLWFVAIVIATTIKVRI
jgi:hypothetical protein